jgi:hypothetical protein
MLGCRVEAPISAGLGIDKRVLDGLNLEHLGCHPIVQTQTGAVGQADALARVTAASSPWPATVACSLAPAAHALRSGDRPPDGLIPVSAYPGRLQSCTFSLLATAREVLCAFRRRDSLPFSVRASVSLGLDCAATRTRADLQRTCLVRRPMTHKGPSPECLGATACAWCRRLQAAEKRSTVPLATTPRLRVQNAHQDIYCRRSNSVALSMNIIKFKNR